MNCEYCDRDNILKAYCYFSKHQEQFLYVWEEEFNLDAFAKYAVYAQLSWKTRVKCKNNAQVAENWSVMLPVLIKALRESKLSEPLQQ
jgi:hypothetical protein